ncbi:MAG: CsbD family protein [Streptomycetaceae bacterium]|nr:CsbD family protein [Streptomycetaceae bacterium]
MGTDDKARNVGDKVRGKTKEMTGRATDDEELKARGKGDQTKGDLKQAGEKVKDAIKDTFKD